MLCKGKVVSSLIGVTLSQLMYMQVLQPSATQHCPPSSPPSLPTQVEGLVSRGPLDVGVVLGPQEVVPQRTDVSQ